MCWSEKRTACWVLRNNQRNITAAGKVSNAPLSVKYGIELHTWPFLVLAYIYTCIEYVICCFVTEILCHTILNYFF